LQNEDGGFGDKAGSQSTVLSTTIILSSLRSLNWPVEVVENAVLYLLGRQNLDGGWSSGAGLESRVSITASVLLTLEDYCDTYELQVSCTTPLHQARNWLRNTEYPGNGFGDGEARVAETALVGLVYLGTAELELNARIRSYILTHQEANGSWADNAYFTALALQYLGTVIQADLVITPENISVDPEYPLPGQPFQAEALIENRSGVNCENFEVAFYWGDSITGTLIETQTVDTLAPFSIASLDVPNLIVTAAGEFSLSVVVYPPYGIVDIDDTNNQATLVFSSSYKNLTMLPENLVFEPAAAQKGEPVTITALVLDTGSEAVSAPYSVSFYQGDPVPGGILLATVQANNHVASFLWAGSEELGTYTITAVVDESNQIQEFNEGDNQAARSVQITAPPDLVIKEHDVSVLQMYASSGSWARVRITVRNLSLVNITEPFAVRMLDSPDGTPVADDVLIDGLAANETVQLVLDWDTTGLNGVYQTVIQVDPDNAVYEFQEDNNQVIKEITISDCSALPPGDDGYVVNPYFSPNNDQVKDTSTLYFAVITSALLNIEITTTTGRTVRSLVMDEDTDSADCGSIVWDGRDDESQITEDGKYFYKLTFTTPNQGKIIRNFAVTVDNDRALVVDVLDRPEFLEFTNYTPEFESDVTLLDLYPYRTQSAQTPAGSINRVTWFPDETGLFFGASNLPLLVPDQTIAPDTTPGPNLSNFSMSVVDLNGDLIEPGDELEYTMVVRNNGDQSALGVVMTNPAMPGFCDYAQNSTRMGRALVDDLAVGAQGDETYVSRLLNGLTINPTIVYEFNMVQGQEIGSGDLINIFSHLELHLDRATIQTIHHVGGLARGTVNLPGAGGEEQEWLLAESPHWDGDALTGSFFFSNGSDQYQLYLSGTANQDGFSNSGSLLLKENNGDYEEYATVELNGDFVSGSLEPGLIDPGYEVTVTFQVVVTDFFNPWDTFSNQAHVRCEQRGPWLSDGRYHREFAGLNTTVSFQSLNSDG
ncbi:CARDB domain-containing protein, partial [candidate division CSSED10-310 bacterium]